MDCSPPGSSVHGVSLGKNIGVCCHACPSRESSQPRDWNQVFHIAGDSLPSEPSGKPKNTGVGSLSFSRGTPWHKDWTRISCIAGGFFASWATREFQLYSSWNVLWHCPSLGLEWKLTFSSPVATAEVSRFADVLSATLNMSSFRILSSTTQIPSSPQVLFLVKLLKAHLNLLTRMSGSRWVTTPSCYLGH